MRRQLWIFLLGLSLLTVALLPLAQAADRPDRTPNCIGLGCGEKAPACVGLGCGEKEPLCVGMGCEKKGAAAPKQSGPIGSAKSPADKPEKNQADRKKDAKTDQKKTVDKNNGAGVSGPHSGWDTKKAKKM